MTTHRKQSSHLDGEAPEGTLRSAFADLRLTSTFKAEKWVTSRLY